MATEQQPPLHEVCPDCGSHDPEFVGAVQAGSPLDPGPLTACANLFHASARVLTPLEHDPVTPKRTFREELRTLVNRHSKENGSNTPDFILAQYLGSCLMAFDNAVRGRDAWYGVRMIPGTNRHYHGEKINPPQAGEGL